MRNKTNDEKINELKELLKTLPQDKQQAMLWIANHYNAAVELCKSEVLSEETRKALLNQAFQQDDMLLAALVLLEQRIHEKKQGS